MITSNWVLSDLLRTFADRTAKGGVLGVQDDLGTVPEDEELPFDRLTRRLGEIGCQLYDHRQTPRDKGSRGDGRAWGTRKLERVTAIAWHQTACVFHEVMRTLSIPAHGCIMPSGDVVLLHPIRAYVPHGHALNSFTVGWEVMCRAAGTEGDSRTFWRSSGEKHGWHSATKTHVKRIGHDPNHPGKWHPPRSYEQLVHEASDKQLDVCEIVAEYNVTEVDRQAEPERAAGKKIPGIVAEDFHRCGHRSRTTDPGSRIAQRVKIIAERYGHEYGGPVVGSGNPIPESWK